MNFFKKSQSMVIASILLILITITLAVVIMNIVIPLIEEKISETDCFDVVDKIEIVNNPKYTCYNLSAKEMNVQVSFGDIRDKINGFKIVLVGESGRSFEIKDGEVDDVRMYNRTAILNLPENNEERTYVILGQSEKPDSMKVYPILNDERVCESLNVMNFIDYCQNG